MAASMDMKQASVATADLTRNPILGYDDLCSFDGCHNVLGAIHVTQHDCCWPTVLIPGNNRVLQAGNKWFKLSINEYQHCNIVQLQVHQLDCSSKSQEML